MYVLSWKVVFFRRSVCFKNCVSVPKFSVLEQLPKKDIWHGWCHTYILKISNYRLLQILRYWFRKWIALLKSLGNRGMWGSQIICSRVQYHRAAMELYQNSHHWHFENVVTHALMNSIKMPGKQYSLTSEHTLILIWW